MTITARHALITGGSRGIGRGIALKLAEQGVHIAVNYLRDEASAKTTLEQVRARGSDGFTVQADVSQPADVERCLNVSVGVRQPRHLRQQCARRGEHVLRVRDDHPARQVGCGDGLTGKGVPRRGPEGRETVDRWRTHHRHSYTPGGVFGSWQSWVAMGAAKSALEVLCRYFAVALAPRGITVNAISPGWTDDSVLNTLPAPVQQMIREHQEAGWTPMRRLGTPADIGDAVALFCAKEAGWITGQVVAADGGASVMTAALPLAIQQPELQPAK